MTVLKLHGGLGRVAGGGGGDGTYISHRIWWMLWEDHSRISRSRSSSATTGAGRIRGPLGDLWLKSRRQGKIGSASLLALWTTFVGCRSSFSRWLAGWLACLQDRSAVESVRSTKCPLGHWPGAVNWRRVRQDQDDLTARVSRRLHVARKCSAVMSRMTGNGIMDHGMGMRRSRGRARREALKP